MPKSFALWVKKTGHCRHRPADVLLGQLSDPKAVPEWQVLPWENLSLSEPSHGRIDPQLRRMAGLRRTR